MSYQSLKPRRLWLKPLQLGCLLTILMALLAGVSLHAGPTVTTLAGGKPSKYYGYADGATLQSLFHTPCGLAIDGTGDSLFVADRDNNVIRYIDFTSGLTWTLDLEPTNMVSKPVGILLNNIDQTYVVLNRGNGTNGSIVSFDEFGNVSATNATKLTNACGIAIDSAGDLFVTVHSNTIVKIMPDGTQTNVATIATPGTSLQGIVVEYNGQLAVCDAGRNGIYNVDPNLGLVTTNAGFNGAGDFKTNSNDFASVTQAKFNQPTSITEAGDGSLIVTDNGNNRVKVISNGTVTNLAGVTRQYWSGSFPGWKDGPVNVPDSNPTNAESRLPFGVVISPNGTVYISEDYYHTIREVTGASFGLPPPPPPLPPINLTASATFGQVSLSWAPVTGATNYFVERAGTTNGPFSIIGSTTTSSYQDSTVLNGATYSYVVVALNTGGTSPNSGVVTVTVPLPAVTDPEIGFVIFNTNGLSVFQQVSPGSYQFNNDATIVIVGSPNSSTYYTSGDTTNLSLVPDPTSSSGSIYSDQPYVDGLTPSQVAPYVVPEQSPYLAVKAIGENILGSPNSGIETAVFQFLTGTPAISGNNAAEFTIGDATTGASLYYTTDGSDPSTNNGVVLGISSNSTNTWTVSLEITTNTLFKVRAYYKNFLPSTIASNVFSSANFLASQISFGFASGEASSRFIGSPGQTFYAPVTLTLLPNTTMYSLAFNVTLSSVGSAPLPIPGNLQFTSMLLKPIPGASPALYTNIPPSVYVSGNSFTNLGIIETNENLIGVSWIERAGATNLYDTQSQDLIQFSQAHDDTFLQAGGQVIVGAYGFTIPPKAQAGQQYQIQLGNVSASSDGVGTPGSSIFLSGPSSGSLSNGAINAIKYVTAGQSLYLVGDAYPFHWFNAGDFGSGELITNGVSDVLQVFESAAYQVNTPPPSTDFYDSMDSAGGYGVYDSADGYYTNAGTLPPSQIADLYNNNDPTLINANLFGDGNLDISDVYVTYVRSIATNNGVLWVQRFWTNGIRAANYTANPSLTANNALPKSAGLSKGQAVPSLSATNQPKVNFSAGDILGSPGQVVSVPINATVFGIYPLRMLLLNLSVVPLDGSPALTTSVSFNPVSSLGAPNPQFVMQSQAGNYAAAWVNNAVAGLTGTTTIGYLNITIPPTANANSSYAVHFDHASGSPSGYVSFPRQTLTGLITLSSRNTSYYNDGIPDSWRLRYFGTVYNYLSVSNADADGDGYSNWQEYVAGTDPTDPTSYLYVAANPVTSGQPNSVQWPSVAGKQYAIQRSATLFPPGWTPVTTVTGTGATMQFNDTVTGKSYYYRVQVQ